jgi:[ribosomal protein S18]-alanine N-acetyltransferase
MVVRKATVRDVELIDAIEQSALDETLGIPFLKQELLTNPFANYYIVEKNEVGIGYIGIRVVDDHGEILNFAVYKEKQRQGYGKFLFEHVLKEMLSLGVSSMSLEVKKSNYHAIAFYEQYGFIQSHLRPNYYKNEDAIVYIKEFLYDYISD